MKLYIDLETYSPTPIKYGSYKYAELSEILLTAYAWGEGPVQVIEGPPPGGFFDRATEIIAHNSQFDRIILEHCGCLPKNDPRWRDTMVRALAHSLPGSLDKLSKLYKLPQDMAKQKQGKSLIRLFCIPQKDGKRVGKAEYPKHWAEFIEYAKHDILAMRVLDKRLPRWNDTEAERRLWLLDRTINDRGFAVDVDYVEKVLKLLDKEKRKCDKRIDDTTTAQTTGQVAKLIEFIKEAYGIEFPDFKKSTVERRLEDPNLPKEVKEILKLRLLGSGISRGKYKALLNAVSSDGRLRGGLQFCGASRTGRWSGRIFQPQNLPRPDKGHKDLIEDFIFGVKHDVADLVFGEIAPLATSALRGAIVGNNIVAADLSAIEGRMLAWLAGEQWKLDAYARGDDLYKIAYSAAFTVPVEEVTGDMRQIGKVMELGLGYQGGVGAFLTFATIYGIDLNDLVHAKIKPWARAKAEYWYYKSKRKYGLTKEVFVACDAIKRMWRAANPKINQFWYDLEDAAALAITTGQPQRVGRVVFDRNKSWLRMRLPSGRYICYANARLVDGKIVYRGINQYTRKWEDLKAYGGKFAEQATQAASRDAFAQGMLTAEAAGFDCILTVHDELVAEGKLSHEKLCECLTQNPDWAGGLPLAAEGFTYHRYRK